MPRVSFLVETRLDDNGKTRARCLYYIFRSIHMTNEIYNIWKKKKNGWAEHIKDFTDHHKIVFWLVLFIWCVYFVYVGMNILTNFQRRVITYQMINCYMNTELYCRSVDNDNHHFSTGCICFSLTCTRHLQLKASLQTLMGGWIRERP